MEQGGRRGVEFVESKQCRSRFFLIFLAVPGSGFCLSAIIPGPSPAGYELWWQTGTLFNRAGVVPLPLTCL